MDLNRAGMPMLEIMSEPDMRTGLEAAEYVAEIQRLVRFLGAGNVNMPEGSLRCDVNISVRPKGRERFGTKVLVGGRGGGGPLTPKPRNPKTPKPQNLKTPKTQNPKSLKP